MDLVGPYGAENGTVMLPEGVDYFELSVHVPASLEHKVWVSASRPSRDVWNWGGHPHSGRKNDSPK